MSGALQDGKAGIVVIIIEPVVPKELHWMNQAIILHIEDQDLLAGSQFFEFMDVIYCSHISVCSLQKGIHTLQWLGHGTNSLALCCYILNHFVAYAPTVPRVHTDSDSTWVAQREQTAQITEMEHITFNLVLRLFFVHVHQLIVVDDDMSDTHSINRQVMTIITRKAHERRLYGR